MSQLNLGIHAKMLADEERNEALFAAIATAIKPGDVVVDLGAGTGFLSILAAKAGASKVYAIEATEMAYVARRLVNDNQLQDVIEIFHGLSFNWQPPQKADVILCETLGFAAFDEKFRHSIADAKKRLLKENGRLIPESVRVLTVPVEHTENLLQPNDLAEKYGFDGDVLKTVFNNGYYRSYVDPGSELAAPAVIATQDCYDIDTNALLESNIQFTIKKAGKLNGFALWFEATLARDIVLSSRSAKAHNHWGQAFLPVNPALHVQENSIIKSDLTMDDTKKTFQLRWNINN